MGVSVEILDVCVVALAHRNVMVSNFWILRRLLVGFYTSTYFKCLHIIILKR